MWYWLFGKAMPDPCMVEAKRRLIEAIRAEADASEKAVKHGDR